MANDLSAPLGKSKRSGLTDLGLSRLASIPYTQISIGLVAFILVTSLGWVLLTDSPDGGQPLVLAKIGNAHVDNAVAEIVANDDFESGPTLVIDPSIDSLGDIAASDDIEAEAEFIDEDASYTTAHPSLLEDSEHGPVPRIGPNGVRPSDVYARASGGGDGIQPRIAILVSGLGLSVEGSRQAIDILPDDITLGFAPYGRSVAKIAKDARLGGHEIMLQIPLEPFDYPENDPGPQTLLTNQSKKTNLDRLFWLMSQIEAYTGIVNYMGGRFTSSNADFTPVIEEIAVRGLSYLDDGSSARSVAGELATANNVPFVQGNIQIDRLPSRPEILRRLGNLEEMATRNGSAIGIASALPVSIKTLAEWASQLESRGIMLVPVSALMKVQ